MKESKKGEGEREERKKRGDGRMEVEKYYLIKGK